MIAEPPSRPLWQLPLWAAAASLLIAGLLQCWRPYFFLTDDSFSLAFPLLVESGQALKNGGDPGVSQFIFDGSYSLRADSMFTPNRHPLAVFFTLLSGTAWENAMVDLISALNLALASAGMLLLLQLLARKGLSALGGKGMIFLALSYTFSGYSLLLGSSGYWYLFNVAALPWMFAALFLPSLSLGLLVMTAAMFHTVIGGYPSCAIFSIGLVAAGAGMRAWMERAAKPLVCFAAGSLLAFLLSLPWLWPALQALAESARGGPLDPAVASEKAMPVAVLMASFFVGSISMIFGNFELFGVKAHAYALASSAASWLVLGAFVPRVRNRAWSFFLLGAALVLLLLISRPAWLAELLYHVPFVRSLRWPYKEVFLFLFVLHLWAARGSLLEEKWTGMLAMVGCIFFLAPLVFFGAPSLSALQNSRELVISGKARAFWEGARKKIDPKSKIVPVVADDILYDIPKYLGTPAPLLGSHNFPALFRIPSWSGYSATLPDKLFRREPRAANVFGVYSISDRRSLLAVPGLTLIELRSLDPLLIVAVDGKTGRETVLADERKPADR